MGCGCSSAKGVSTPVQSAAGATASGSSAAPPSKEILQKKVEQAQSTRVLALRECGLKQLPSAVSSTDGSNFRTVDVSINSLTSLPEVVSSWTGLQNFLCEQNSLTELPAGVCRLESLQKFILSRNSLRTLPADLSQLGKLKILQLDSNKLGPKLPDVFGGGALSDALEELDLSRNSLKELAPSLGGLVTLTRLILADNELKELPEYLGGLRKLNYLDAASNKITGISPTLLENTPLSELWLKGNPMDRLKLQETTGFNAFLERRKARIDAKIDSQVVGELNLAVCGLD